MARFLLLAILALWAVSSLAAVRTGDLMPGPQGLDVSVREGRIVAAMAPDTGLMWLVPPDRASWRPALPKLWFLYVEDCPVGTMAGLPLWMPAVLAALALLGARVTRRGREGRCAACGYEIGIRDARVCPECGEERL